MQYLWLTEDADGISHFADGTIPLALGDFAPPAPPLLISESEPSARVVFLTLPPGWGGEKHRSPRRQIDACLSGRLSIEAGDGAVREIGAGGIWRMEDTRGQGHVSRVVGDAPVELMIVQLD